MEQVASSKSTFFTGPYPLKLGGSAAKRQPGPDMFFQRAWLKLKLSRGWVSLSDLPMSLQQAHSRVIQVHAGDTDYALARMACIDRAIVQCQSRESALEAAVLAACSLAMRGTRVHLVFANPPDSLPVLQQLAASLGLSVGWVREGMPLAERKQGYQARVCVASARQLMYDFLLDQKILGQSRSPLLSRLKLSLRETPQLMLPGLCCAVVAEAYEVLIEQGERPVGISETMEMASGHAQIFHREALLLAKSLDAGVHFEIENTHSVVLSEAGRERLKVASEDMGPLWRGSRRRESIVLAALSLQLVLQNNTQPVPELSSIVGRLPRLDGVETSDYSKLYAACTSNNPAVNAPPVSMRLCAQNFFPRYLHLSGVGWLLQPRLKELERMYDLIPGPATGSDPIPVQYPRLFRDVDSWQVDLEAELKRLSEDGCDVLVVCPGPTEKDELESRMPKYLQAMDISGDGIGRTDRATSVLIEELLALPPDHKLQSFDHVLFAGTPPTMLQEIKVIEWLGGDSEIVFGMWASPEDPVFEARSFFWGPLASLNRWFFLRRRVRIERLESRGREQVAAQDAYINDVLSFSTGRD